MRCDVPYAIVVRVLNQGCETASGRLRLRFRSPGRPCPRLAAMPSRDKARPIVALSSWS